MSKEIFAASALGLMVLGEFCIIYSEVAVARLAQAGSTSWETLTFPVLLACFSGLCLMAAYWLGYRAVGDIWLVTVVSVTSLLMLEPLVIWSMFHEMPGRGEMIGFCLGALGLVAAVFL